MLPGLSAEEGRDLLLSVGTHHGKRRLSPVEVAEVFNKSISAGASPSDCARFVHLNGPTMVSRFLKLLKLTPNIRHIVDWGQTGATMSFEAAWRLGELNSEEQDAAAQEIVANQMGKEEVRQIIQIRHRSNRDIKQCVAEVLGMRSSVTRKHVFLGGVIGADIKRALAAMHQADRDALFGGVMKEAFGSVRIAGRLGAERFTLVTDEQGAARLKEGPEDFESIINRGLVKRVLAT
jgi:hypothetical protein